ncbi:hypothetical protein L3V16_22815 [Brucella ciceri]|uniref:hypothetical protein n=1 Tax=Brucella ciceri TaxID=391287 RepID=UPI0013B02E9A|nr:hypothetical protein [Brucella ciceri]MCH6206656.1 hypothetical protein [Brucella ciceri]
MMHSKLIIELDEKIAIEAVNGVLHRLFYSRQQFYNGIQLTLKRAKQKLQLNILHFDTTAITMVLKPYETLEELMREYAQAGNQIDRDKLLYGLSVGLNETPTFSSYADFKAWFMQRGDYREIHQSLVRDKRLNNEYRALYANSIIILTWMLLPRWARSEAKYTQKWSYLAEAIPFNRPTRN